MAQDLPVISDEELARQTQAGSVAAFEELVSRYEHRVYAFVTQFSGHATDPADVTQEAFVRAFQSIQQFNPRHTFAAWLFTIARNKAIDHFRAAPPPAREDDTPELPDNNDPAELLAVQEERLNLWRAARRVLSDTQYQALWLKYTEEMSVAQIARVLRKTQTHVKVLLFRARLALGRELERAQASALNASPVVVAGHRTSRLAPEVSRL